MKYLILLIANYNQLWLNNVITVYGWVVNDHLKPLALKAIAASNTSNTYGILKATTNWAYYHALPPVHRKQKEWVNIVSQQFKNME